MESQDYGKLLAALREQQAARPLSILNLAEPLTASSASAALEPQGFSNTRASDASTQLSRSESDSSTPQSLKADLAHYKDLFSKLRFSYLEQVTKEKYLRAIVGDPPLLVSHGDNLVLEEKLAVMKAELKGKKAEVDALVKEMENMAAELARKHDKVQTDMIILQKVPTEIANLREQVNVLRSQLVERKGAGERSRDPRMNMSLDATNEALEAQQKRNQELDEQIEALQRQLPARIRECEKADRELEDLEAKRNESVRFAKEVRRIREEGGRDILEEQGRWYRSSEVVLKGLLGVEA